MNSFYPMTLRILRERLNGKPFAVEAEEWERLTSLLLAAARSSGEPATPDDFLGSVRALCVAARTTGGTAGRDDGLCQALDRVETMLQAIADPDWQRMARQPREPAAEWQSRMAKAATALRETARMLETSRVTRAACVSAMLKIAGSLSPTKPVQFCYFEDCDQSPECGPYCRAHYNQERGWPDEQPLTKEGK